MNWIIRNAVMKDYESVLHIMNQVQQMHVHWRPDIYRPNPALIPPEAFAKMVEGDTCFVAEADGRVVGVMELLYRHIETPSHVTRNVIFIDTMAVEESYRGRGIGHLFFEKVRQIKEQKRCDGIELQVNAKNQAAYDMYANYGFTVKSINMELL